jgi:hypothetical protein
MTSSHTHSPPLTQFYTWRWSLGDSSPHLNPCCLRSWISTWRTLYLEYHVTMRGTPSLHSFSRSNTSISRYQIFFSLSEYPHTTRINLYYSRLLSVLIEPVHKFLLTTFTHGLLHLMKTMWQAIFWMNLTNHVSFQPITSLSLTPPSVVEMEVQ